MKVVLNGATIHQPRLPPSSTLGLDLSGDKWCVFVCALCVSGVHIDENGKRSLLNCTLPSLTQRYAYLPMTCSLPTVDGDAAVCVLYKCASMSSRSPPRMEKGISKGGGKSGAVQT